MVPAVLDRGDGEGLAEIHLIAEEVAPALLGEIAHEDRVGVILVVEGKGRLRIAGGESGELDESATQRRTRGARVDTEIQLDEGPERAVFGCRSRVESDAGRAVEARRIAIASLRVIALIFGTHQAADLQAGVGARDIEEAGAEIVADLHILDRLGLRHREVGRQGGTRTQHRASREQEQSRCHVGSPGRKWRRARRAVRTGRAASLSCMAGRPRDPEMGAPGRSASPSRRKESTIPGDNGISINTRIWHKIGKGCRTATDYGSIIPVKICIETHMKGNGTTEPSA